MNRKLAIQLITLVLVVALFALVPSAVGQFVAGDGTSGILMLGGLAAVFLVVMVSTAILSRKKPKATPRDPIV